MIDVKEKAAEKARQKIESSKQPGVESERQKARRQLKDEISSYTGENVMLIAASSPQHEETVTKKIRTAAYCRVSTDDVGQVISIEMQKKEYRKKIMENPGWEYFGTYVDDGFSGTNTAHRPAFRRMMEDAMAGKFEIFPSKLIQTHYDEHGAKPLEIRGFAAFA